LTLRGDRKTGENLNRQNDTLGLGKRAVALKGAQTNRKGGEGQEFLEKRKEGKRTSAHHRKKTNFQQKPNLVVEGKKRETPRRESWYAPIKGKGKEGVYFVQRKKRDDPCFRLKRGTISGGGGTKKRGVGGKKKAKRNLRGRNYRFADDAQKKRSNTGRRRGERGLHSAARGVLFAGKLFVNFS